ncbi:hypothetical protein RCG17_19980 [Neobacillus sp. PS3-12]|uniref:hypothetical protein n=1 Tax=Neobacillus sp. PS3-12 TaxID=3070677 RepID=UPI0027E0822E|nr:hypothetical protein [Neobacillus sp. PS3-12]WML51693.1 hypothetical protein RCG17_19980 [Neobacillus sp. PS3-12]
MGTPLQDTKNLFDSIFSHKQKQQVVDILKEINENINEYKTDFLWGFDKEIGGIGGYCLPCDPKLNPYPAGEYRKLFRPLQYARSEIEIINVHFHSRYTVIYSGMHLEEVVRIVLKRKKILGIRYFNSTLGKAAHILSKEQSIPRFLIDGLFYFVKNYNLSKHEVNMDEERERLFIADDAIICYLAARIIGHELLKLIEHDSTKYIYSIDTTEFVF